MHSKPTKMNHCQPILRIYLPKGLKRYAKRRIQQFNMTGCTTPSLLPKPPKHTMCVFLFCQTCPQIQLHSLSAPNRTPIKRSLPMLDNIAAWIQWGCHGSKKLGKPKASPQAIMLHETYTNLCTSLYLSNITNWTLWSTPQILLWIVFKPWLLYQENG